MAYECDPLEGGDVIEVGDLEIEVLHALGRTTETVTYRVGDEAMIGINTGRERYESSREATRLETSANNCVA